MRLFIMVALLLGIGTIVGIAVGILIATEKAAKARQAQRWQNQRKRIAEEQEKVGGELIPPADQFICARAVLPGPDQLSAPVIVRGSQHPWQ